MSQHRFVVVVTAPDQVEAYRRLGKALADANAVGIESFGEAPASIAIELTPGVHDELMGEIRKRRT